MADKMPPELLKRFEEKREENKAPSGEELKAKSQKRKDALAKARKAKAMGSKK
jgi:hypothetical protein